MGKQTNNSDKALALTAGILVGSIAFSQLFRKYTKRSLSSWMIERGLFLSGMRRQQEAMLAGDLEKYIAWNSKTQSNPSRILGKKVIEESFMGMQVFSWNGKEDSAQPTIFYLHGGGNSYPPAPTHYLTLRHIMKETDARVVMPIYLKTPKYTYEDSLPLVYMRYLKMLTEVEGPVILMGDSSGGGIALGLADQLRSRGISQPAEIILISPWLDMTNSNPEMADYDAFEPMISQTGLNLASHYWIGEKGDPNDPRVSPINVSAKGLAPITLFVGTHEVFYPDICLYADKLEKEGADYKLHIFEKMNHIFPVYPIPEGHKARMMIADIINQHRL